MTVWGLVVATAVTFPVLVTTVHTFRKRRQAERWKAAQAWAERELKKWG